MRAEQGNFDVAKQIFSGAGNKRSSAMNRRKFSQTVLASLPAASLACALPVTASGSTANAAADYVCLVDLMFEIEGVGYYLAMNCRSQQTWTYVGPAGLQLGACSDPLAGGCVVHKRWEGYVRTDDVLQLVLSPELTASQLRQVDLFRSMMLMNAKT